MSTATLVSEPCLHLIMHRDPDTKFRLWVAWGKGAEGDERERGREEAILFY